MIKGLFSTLTAATLTLIGASASFAAAPVISGIPDISIGDIEDNIGTDNNFFVFTNAFRFDDYVTDTDSTESALLWSFDEDDDTSGGVQNWFKINNKDPMFVGSVAIAGSGQGAVGGPHATPPVGNELRNGNEYATFRDFIFTPSPSAAGNEPTEPDESLHAAGKLVILYAADEAGNVASQGIIVSTIDNTTSDSFTGAPVFQPIIETTALATNWTQSGLQTPASYGTSGGTILSTIGTGSNQFRLAFWTSNPNSSASINYTQIGTGKYVRNKFFIYGQNTSPDTNANNIPGFRIRVANRFAATSMLEAFHNGSPVGNSIPADSEGLTLAQDFRPSNSPSSPSIYRVDYDPIDVPRLVTNAANEWILLGFEAFALGDAEAGTIGLTEVSLGVYDALPNSPGNLAQSYLAADLDVTGRSIATGVSTTANGITKPTSGNTLPTTTAEPTIAITGNGTTGVTIDTRTVPTNRLGIAAVDYFGTLLSSTNKLLRLRIARDEQYKVRFHATSTANSIDNGQIRFRAVTVKFQWNQKFEVGPGRLQGAASNGSLLAREMLPGVGNLNPEKQGAETNGGWYNLLMASPMNASIRASQPNLDAQDETGEDTGVGNANSRRDLKIGIDILDGTEDETVSAINGLVTIDRVDIYKYPLVEDGDL